MKTEFFIGTEYVENKISLLNSAFKIYFNQQTINIISLLCIYEFVTMAVSPAC